MFTVLPVGLLGLLASDLVGAVHLPIHARRVSHPVARDTTNNIYGVSSLDNGQDFKYYTDLTLGGETFSVLIDTGSSDLWVAGTVPGAINTGFTSGVQYAVGEVQGPIMTADLTFAGHDVSSQAFLEITPSSDNPATLGLIGLGPNTGSSIFNTVGGLAGGLPVLDRIFRENTSTPNYITVLMGRYLDQDETFAHSGSLTVGELLSGYENVTSQPQLAVTTVSITDQSDQHWQTLLDANGISVGGQTVTGLTTTVPTTANSAQLTAVFDTGFTIPQVTSQVAAAIYSSAAGASLKNVSSLGEIWVLPCDSEIDVTFTFGGVQIPIHPLDTVLDANLTNSNSPSRPCVGGFQPISTDSGGNYDLILGMAFVRNAYLLINFGDFVDSTAVSTLAPYIQMLPITTNSTAAHLEFQEVRGASSAASGSNSSSSGSPSPTGKAAARLGATVSVLVAGTIVGASVVFGMVL